MKNILPILQFVTTLAILGSGIYFRTKIVKEVEHLFTVRAEKLKADLNKQVLTEIEALRALYSKENIRFQISQTEFIKMRFEKLTLLFSLILEIRSRSKRYIQYTIAKPMIDEPDVDLKCWQKLIRKAEDLTTTSSFFINEESTTDKIRGYLFDSSLILLAAVNHEAEKKGGYHSLPKETVFMQETESFNRIPIETYQNLHSLLQTTDTIFEDIHKLMKAEIDVRIN